MKQIISLMAILAFATSAYADSVSVANGSFEEPDLSTGNTWTNDLTGWTPGGDSFIELIGGFSSDGAQHLGMGGGASVFQDLAIGLTPNTEYTLTVNVGKRDGWAEGTSVYGLYAGTLDADPVLAEITELASGSMAAADVLGLGEGMFSGDVSVSYATGSTIEDGNLIIGLSSGDGNRAHFDNIRLDAVAVPEPAGLALLMVGGLGFLGLRRR